jgi:hypothetical protein
MRGVEEAALHAAAVAAASETTPTVELSNNPLTSPPTRKKYERRESNTKMDSDEEMKQVLMGAEMALSLATPLVYPLERGLNWKRRKQRQCMRIKEMLMDVFVQE